MTAPVVFHDDDTPWPTEALDDRRRPFSRCAQLRDHSM
jgi:hypothetical protein